MNNYRVKLCSWKFKFRYVVTDSCEVADYIIPSSLQFILECNSERIIKTGAHLPKLSQKDCIDVLFWLTVYIPRPIGVVVLTDNTSKYKEFIVTCNTKTHYDENSFIMSKKITIIKNTAQWACRLSYVKLWWRGESTEPNHSLQWVDLIVFMVKL